MVSLTHKERLKQALLHQPLDRLPTQINYTPKMGEVLAAHWGLPVRELPFFLDNHLIRLELTFEERLASDGEVRFDWWGAGHSTSEEGYFIRHSPLAENGNLDDFPWPDPNQQNLIDGARILFEKFGQEFFLMPNFGWALFERAWSLRSFEQLLMDMVLDPGYVGELMDRIVDIQLVLIQRFLDLGVDGAYFGDDYGAQNGLLFSPKTWRSLIKPRLQRMFEPFRQRDLPVVMHSDGAIQQVLPDLVEIGLTTLNPVQPEVLDHHWLRNQFGNRLSYYGGVSTQTVLPFGTPEMVKAAVFDCCSGLAPDGTGLLIGPSHRLMTDIPIANVEALLEGFKGLPG